MSNTSGFLGLISGLVFAGIIIALIAKTAFGWDVAAEMDKAAGAMPTGGD